MRRTQYCHAIKLAGKTPNFTGLTLILRRRSFLKILKKKKKKKKQVRSALLSVVCAGAVHHVTTTVLYTGTASSTGGTHTHSRAAAEYIQYVPDSDGDWRLRD